MDKSKRRTVVVYSIVQNVFFDVCESKMKIRYCSCTTDTSLQRERNYFLLYFVKYLIISGTTALNGPWHLVGFLSLASVLQSLTPILLMPLNIYHIK
jgi:hypothetical protein